MYRAMSGSEPPKTVIPRQQFRCNEEELIKVENIAGMLKATSLNAIHRRSMASATTAIYEDVANFTFGPTSHKMESKTGKLSSTTDYPATIIALYSLVFILAAVGNILVLITLISNRRMRTVTNCFLISLSLSDLLQALVCMPISLIGQVLKRFIFGSVLCKIFPYFMGISVSVSTFTLLALAIERYNAICNPLKSRGWQTKSHAYKVIAGIWFLSFLIMSPFLVFSQLRYIPLVRQGKCTLACRLYFGGEQASQAWYVLQSVVLLCIPGSVMAVTYACVCFKIFEGFHFENKDKTQQSSKKSYFLTFFCVKVREPEQHGNNNTNEIETKLLKGVKLSILEYSKFKTNTEHAQSTGRQEMGRGRSVRRTNDSRSLQTEGQLTAKRRVVKMLLVVVVLFFVCWTPLFMVNVWKAFDPKGARRIFSGVIEVIQLLSYISTCVNPVTYCFMNKKFREGFLRAFICCLPKRCASAVENQQPSHASPMVQSENSQSMYLTSTPRNQRRSSNRSRTEMTK
uniref:G-protein coupled receptors family 1 profile domain-containing protein n=1 Tax=Ciona savignyi TaxID=51511 RepID=H2YV51_CIOSA